MKTVAFFNRKNVTGKASLLYHLAWMLRELGLRVLAIDLDPQSNLTSEFLNDSEIESLWSAGSPRRTILGAVEPLIENLADIRQPDVTRIAPGLDLIPGDLGLSHFEDRLSEAWFKCLDDNPANAGDGFRVMTSFYRIMAAADPDIVLIDVGPSLDALNRGALVSADYVVFPLGADLFSIEGLRNLGPTIRSWRQGWQIRMRGKIPENLTPIPTGAMSPLGYVLLNLSLWGGRPIKTYKKWADRIPRVYQQEILEKHPLNVDRESDPNRLAMLKHFKSLMPMAQDVRKPMFLLKPADGAIGGHAAAVQDCYKQFETLALHILKAAGLSAARAIA